MKRVLLLTALLAIAPTVDAQQEARECTRLTKSYMSTTRDGGATFIPFKLPTRQALSITWGLAALDDAGTLVMQADDMLWGSENDGCSWRRISNDAVGLYRVAAASGGYAYAWQDNGGAIFQVRHGDTPSTRWDVTFRDGKVSDMKGFGVDPTDPLHIRTAGDPGQIWESFDGGATWAPVGVPAFPGGVLGYVMAFDPNDIDHAVYGRVSDGGFVTFDGGLTWTPSTGLTATAGSSANLFNAVISPVDGNTVFAAASDGSSGSLRGIYASTDGGLTFARVVTDNVGGVFLQNQPVMEADANDANVVRFIYSVSPGSGGTFFYTYDLGADTLSTVPNAGLPKVRVFESSRNAPGSIHVGFDYF